MPVVDWDDLTEQQRREIFESPAVQEAFGYRLIADGIEHLEEQDEELADRMVDATHSRVSRVSARETTEQILDAFREVIKERTAPLPTEEYGSMNNDAETNKEY